MIINIICPHYYSIRTFRIGTIKFTKKLPDSLELVGIGMSLTRGRRGKEGGSPPASVGGTELKVKTKHEV